MLATGSYSRERSSTSYIGVTAGGAVEDGYRLQAKQSKSIVVLQTEQQKSISCRPGSKGRLVYCGQSSKVSV
jgi:hypothetical protein